MKTDESHSTSPAGVPGAAQDSAVSSLPAHAPAPRPRGKVFDVMRPGRAPASPTSRPVVIGHKTGAQALQVQVSGIGEPAALAHGAGQNISAQTQAEVGGVVPSTAPVAAHGEGKEEKSSPAELQPPAGTMSSVPAAESASPEPTDSTSSDQADDLPSTDPVKLTEAALDPEPPAVPAASTHIPIPVSSEDAPAHDPVHDVAPPSLDGQVVVSHHTTAPRGTGKLIALLVLVFFFALIILDILLDVGIINSSALPHTNFF